jgi:hypothetical protein
LLVQGLDDLLFIPVHDGDQGNRKCEKVGIEIPTSLMLGKQESLEVAVIHFGGIHALVGPWLDDDLEAFWLLELLDLGLMQC